MDLNNIDQHDVLGVIILLLFLGLWLSTKTKPKAVNIPAPQEEQ